MSKTERVTLTGLHTHVSTLEDGRELSHTFAEGVHTLPAEIAQSAREAGLVAPSAATNAVREPKATAAKAKAPAKPKARPAAKAKAAPKSKAKAAPKSKAKA